MAAAKLIGNTGGLTEPVMVNVLATGAISVGDIVMRHSLTTGMVTRATATAYPTTIFGVAQSALAADAVPGYVNVIPFMQGQLWQVDCQNTVSTAQLMIAHAIQHQTAINNTTTNTSLGIFLAYYVGDSSSTGTLVGEFLRLGALAGT